MLILEALKRLRALGLPEGEYIVIGSAVMHMHGLREAGDLDVLVSSDVYVEFAKKYEQVGGGAAYRIAIDDDIELCYLSSEEGVDLTRLLENSECYCGIPFESLIDVLIRKERRSRQKDCEDTALIRKYLNKCVAAQRLTTVRRVAEQIIADKPDCYADDLSDLLPPGLRDIGLTDHNTAIITKEIEEGLVSPLHDQMASLLGLSDDWRDDEGQKKVWVEAVNSDRSYKGDREVVRQKILFLAELGQKLVHL